MGFKRSSSEPKKCGYTEHPFQPFQGSKDEPGEPHCLTCGHVWGECSWHGKPDLRCTCGCLRSQHMGKPRGCLKHAFHEFVCDHTRCGWTPPEEDHDFSSPSHCQACMRAWIGPDAVLEDAEDVPLTPEEEEAAPVDEKGACSHTESGSPCDWNVCRQKAEEPPPPQPDRRPPYAVAYSVQGHLYEVALSGDATVRAVDGALVIQHHLGPVAGIVSVLPVINKESNGTDTDGR